MVRTNTIRLRSSNASNNGNNGNNNQQHPTATKRTMVSLSPKASDVTSASPMAMGKRMMSSSNNSSSSNSRLGKISENPAAESLEILTDASPWKNMDVRSSDESPIGFLTSRRGLCILVFALVLFLMVLVGVFDHEANSTRSHLHHSTNNGEDENEELVAPIHGQAYLSPAEFRSIRTALPGESVLLTGGLGFIGSHVVDLLLHRGFEVTILDDESNGHNHNRFAKEMVPHDITVVGDFPAFPDEKKGDGYYTHVIHLAAAISVAESMNDPDKYERINYDGSQKVLDWIHDYNQHIASMEGENNGGTPGPIRKVVAASSAAIYGDPDPSLLPLQESTPYGGLSPYADTKYRMEGLMRNFVQKQNDEANSSSSVQPAGATALRFFNVYGPRQDPKNPYSGVISLFLEAAMSNKDITILGDGLMTRDFVYVKDVARAIVLALLQEPDSKKSNFAVYNVCTGKSITINTLAEQVKQSMKSNSKITHLDPRDGDIRESSCNPDGAKGGIGFVSAVPQEGGLEKTAGWFRLQDESRR